MTMSNQVAVVTGGGTGIGLATTKLLFERGCSIVINGRRADVLDRAATSLDPAGERIATVAGDISDPKTAQAIADVATARFGGVDILVNNAGIFAPSPFLDQSIEELGRYVDVILKGTFLTSQACIPSMQARGGGAIVNVGSMWALQAVNKTPSAAYSAAKAGVHALTKNLALEFAAANIRVNAVAPAVVETPVYEAFIPVEQVEAVLDSFHAFHPLGRNGKAEDVAQAIGFLSSDDSGWVTGTILPVDGGVMAGLHG